MLRKIFAACIVLALVLGACGEEGAISRGLLSRDELEKLESLYLSDAESALRGLGFSEKDLDRDSEDYLPLSSAGAYPVKKGRSIGGRVFRQIVLTSVTEPEGLYGIRFYANFNDQQEAENARDALRDVVEDLYGEPAYPEAESWTVGETTELSLHFFRAEDAANFDPSWDYRYSLEVEYRIPSVVDGKRLSGDEMAEMVRNAQDGPSGLLTKSEIEKNESLYFVESEQALKDLGISEGDIDIGKADPGSLSHSGAYALKKARSIEGADFIQIVLTSISEPEGFYGVRFHANFMEHEDAAKMVRDLHGKFTELYGDPTTYEGLGSRLSVQLDDPQSGCEYWHCSGLTQVVMQLFRAEDAANFDPEWDFRYGLELDYRVRSTDENGLVISGDEMLEMVRNAQEK